MKKLLFTLLTMVLCLSALAQKDGGAKNWISKNLGSAYSPVWQGCALTLEVSKDRSAVVTEIITNWQIAVSRLYDPEGKAYKLRVTKLEKLTQMLEIFDREMLSERHSEFALFALVDVDNDKQPELWLRSEDGVYNALFCIHDENIRFVAGSDDKVKLSVRQGIVQTAIVCGEGCSSKTYVEISGSWPKHSYVETQQWNTTAGILVKDFSCDGNHIPTSEGLCVADKAMMANDIVPVWHKIGEP